MRIEIISVGKEVLAGAEADTLSPYLAKRFSTAGITVARITCIEENSREIASSIRESMARETRVLAVAGGLGPMRGNVTLRAVSDVAGVKLLADQAALLQVKKRWETLSRKETVPFSSPSPELLKMAVIPSGAELLENRIGIAPGIKMRAGGMTIYCLPGEEGEMRPMFDEAVYPEVVLLIGGGAVAVRRLKIRSRDATLLRRRIRMIEGRFPSISVITRPHRGGGEGDIIVEFISAEAASTEESSVEKAVQHFQEYKDEAGKGEDIWIAE